MLNNRSELIIDSEKPLQCHSTQLDSLAYTDPLTECMNSRALFEKTVKNLNSVTSSYTLLVMDLDNFHKINGRFGREAGDAALMHFATIVKSIIREGDIFARLGGVEFVIVLPKLPFRIANLVAERVRETIAVSPLTYNKRSIGMTVSIGIVTCKNGVSGDFHDMIRKADAALCVAKENGKNKVVHPQ